MLYDNMSPLRILFLIPVLPLKNSFMTIVASSMCHNYLYTCYMSTKHPMKNGAVSSPSLDHRPSTGFCTWPPYLSDLIISFVFFSEAYFDHPT